MSELFCVDILIFLKIKQSLPIVRVESFLLRRSIFADVYLGRLSEVELLISCLLHQIEQGVLEHVLEHTHEVVLQEHALPEEFLVSHVFREARHQLQLALELLAVLVAILHLDWCIDSLSESVEVRGLLIVNV